MTLKLDQESLERGFIQLEPIPVSDLEKEDLKAIRLVMSGETHLNTDAMIAGIVNRSLRSSGLSLKERLAFFRKISE